MTVSLRKTTHQDYFQAKYLNVMQSKKYLFKRGNYFTMFGKTFFTLCIIITAKMEKDHFNTSSA